MANARVRVAFAGPLLLLRCKKKKKNCDCVAVGLSVAGSLEDSVPPPEGRPGGGTLPMPRPPWLAGVWPTG